MTRIRNQYVILDRRFPRSLSTIGVFTTVRDAKLFMRAWKHGGTIVPLRKSGRVRVP